MSSKRHLALGSRGFDDLSTVKRRFGMTVNDVLLATSAGALRRLAQDRGEDGRPLKAMMPVIVAEPGEQWGNRIAFLFVELPCHEPDLLRRLRDVHVAMRERKRGGQPSGAEALLSALSYAPRALRRPAALSSQARSSRT